MRLFRPICLVATGCLIATPASAQLMSRGALGALGVAAVSDEGCPVTGLGGEGAKVEAVDPVSLLLATVGGDVVAAGMSALGAALEEASKEKSFYSTGATEYGFYRAAGDTPSRLAVRQVCVIFAVPASEPDATEFYLYQPTNGGPWIEGRAPDPGFTETGEERARRPEVGPGVLQKLSLPTRLAFYMEAEVMNRQDGFVLIPRLVWRRGAVGKAPDRPLPGEIHVSFSLPGSVHAQTSVAFAVAQIPLPPLGDKPLQGDDLRVSAGGALPLRPLTGSAERFSDGFRALQTTIESAQAEQQAVLRLRPDATDAAADASTPAERRAAQAASRALDHRETDASTREKTAEEARDKLLAEAEAVALGTTNVQVRLVQTRDANAFGVAVGQALAKRAPEIGTAVTQALTPRPAWTPEDTTYVNAMAVVREKEAALAAIAAEDISARLSAEVALIGAKAAANSAAVARNLPPPFPYLG